MHMNQEVGRYEQDTSCFNFHRMMFCWTHLLKSPINIYSVYEVILTCPKGLWHSLLNACHLNFISWESEREQLPCQVFLQRSLELVRIFHPQNPRTYFSASLSFIPGHRDVKWRNQPEIWIQHLFKLSGFCFTWLGFRRKWSDLMNVEEAKYHEENPEHVCRDWEHKWYWELLYPKDGSDHAQGSLYQIASLHPHHSSDTLQCSKH